MRRVFSQYWGKSKKGLSMTPIFLVVGKEGGRKARRREERRRGKGGEGVRRKKKGSCLGERGEEGERGGRRLKMVMDIEVEEGDGEKKGGERWRKALIGEEVGGGKIIIIKGSFGEKGEKGVENGDGYRSLGGR